MGIRRPGNGASGFGVTVSNHRWIGRQEAVIEVGFCRDGETLVATVLAAPANVPTGHRVLLALLEVQRGGVYAEAFAGGLGTVVENVAQVSVAAATEDLGPLHAGAVVRFALYMFFFNRHREAGPTTAGVELRVGT